MQCNFLVQNREDPNTIALLKENIRRISDGSSSHSARALDLVLEKFFQSKKQGKGEKLRCHYYNCAWLGSLISYSSVRFHVYCPMCEHCVLQCNGCGFKRISSSSSCQGCGRKFV